MKIKTKELKAGQIKFDDRNANLHTDEGRRLVNKSIEELGAGRSVLTDKNGKLIAGNLTVEEARKQGVKFVEVETDGKTLIVVKRSDLDLDSKDDNRARQLAIADNSTAAVSLEWNFGEIKKTEEDFDFDASEWGLGILGNLPDYSGNNKEIDVDEFEDSCIIKLEYTLEDFHQVKSALHKIAETPEQAVWQLLKLSE